MLARVMTSRFAPVIEAFDDGSVQEFLKVEEIFAIRDHFLSSTRCRTGRSALVPNARQARR